MISEFEQEALKKLERIALAQERSAKANEEYTTANKDFQKTLIAAFTPLIPAMLAMFSQSFLPTQSMKIPQ
jgi:hypothetical protein